MKEKQIPDMYIYRRGRNTHDELDGKSNRQWEIFWKVGWAWWGNGN